MKPVLRNCHLYVITDLKTKDPSIFRKADRALRGGADILQLRSKMLLDQEFLEIGKKLKKIAKRHHKLFIINDRPHIAHLIGSDGLHLGQGDLSIKEARKIVGRKMIVGKSTHSLRQAIQAEREGADYIGVGPVFQTPTKPNYRSVGLLLVKQVAKCIRIPFVAIGGIDTRNINEVVAAGALCVAVVRAIFSARDPKKAAQRLKKLILSANNE